MESGREKTNSKREKTLLKQRERDKWGIIHEPERGREVNNNREKRASKANRERERERERETARQTKREKDLERLF